ncbi:MAG: hypothetical protein SF069_12260 [Phycisphaerae bacterium]|nr:hypothetical protein [Phycisphaerae bacterium]
MDESAFLRLLASKRTWQARPLFGAAGAADGSGVAEDAAVLKAADRSLRFRDRLEAAFRVWAGNELSAAARVLGYQDGILEIGARDSVAYAELHRRSEGLLSALRRSVHCPLKTVRVVLGDAGLDDWESHDADAKSDRRRGADRG